MADQCQEILEDGSGSALASPDVTLDGCASDSPYALPPTDWGGLVDRVQTGDPDGMEELYRVFARGIRFFLCRQLGPQDLEDRVHDVFVIVVQAIRRGDLREPERLMGFVRTIVRRQVAAFIEQAVQRRREQTDLETGVRLVDARRTPEETAVRQQRRELIRNVMDSLAHRDREILTRFYLHEQSQEQICEEMSLTETQFRLLKSRAKARFGQIGKRKLQQKSLNAFFLRTSVTSLH